MAEELRFSEVVVRGEHQITNSEDLRSALAMALRLENAGQFPNGKRLGQNREAWMLTEVEAWIEERLAKRDA